MITAVLECVVCQTRKSSQLSDDLQLTLRDSGACLLPCPVCNRSTFWTYAGHDRRPGREGQIGTSAAVGRGREARRQHRAPLQLPVRVRVWGLEPVVEVTTTFNVSRGGIYFLSDKTFRVGQDVRVALHYSSQAAGQALEQSGHVVRVDQIAGNPKRGVAIKYAERK